MSRLGMDPVTIRALAGQIDTVAGSLEAVIGSSQGAVDHALSVWFGSDVEEFHQLWYTTHRPALTSVLVEIRRLASTARTNAMQQEGASAAPSNGELNAAVRRGAGMLGVLGTAITTYAHGALQITLEHRGRAHPIRNVKDLIGLLDESRNGSNAYDYPGGISVTFTGTPPHRNAIVAVSGTEDWSLGSRNIDDSMTNLQNLFGIHTAKELAIRQAMIEAGVTSQDKVMLVGHSQGGADVLYFAHDYANDKQFNVQAVVTVGAPGVTRYPPSNVDVLQLQGSNDLVPGVGLPFDPLAPSNVHAVGVRDPFFDSPITAHEPSTYQAKLPDHSAQISQFEHHESEFFSGDDGTTYVYSNERAEPDPVLQALTHPQLDLLTPVRPVPLSELLP